MTSSCQGLHYNTLNIFMPRAIAILHVKDTLSTSRKFSLNYIDKKHASLLIFTSIFQLACL